MGLILGIHAFTTFFMAGLCWFVQIVHYPLFHEINLEDFPRYEKKNAATAYITVPVMVLELATGLYLLYDAANFFTISNVILLGIIGLSTFIFQVPMHVELMHIASHKTISKLIKTNWIRTISWTIRSVLLMSYIID